MTRTIFKDVAVSLLVSAALAIAIALMWYAMVTRAHADGLLVPPPPPPAYGYGPPPPPLYSLPTPGFQGPPSQSCIETAIQLAYQTGSRQVGNAAAEACRYFAPVNFPYARNRYYGPPLGWQPPR
jgi:hypothetical protein